MGDKHYQQLWNKNRGYNGPFEQIGRTQFTSTTVPESEDHKKQEFLEFLNDFLGDLLEYAGKNAYLVVCMTTETHNILVPW